MNNTIAIFHAVGANRDVYLKSTILGGLYRQWQDSYAGDETTLHAKLDSEAIANGEMTVKQSPYPMYHCWHICFCDECEQVGGKVFDHSQGAWNEHLRYVPNDRLFTFPSAEGSK